MKISILENDSITLKTLADLRPIVDDLALKLVLTHENCEFLMGSGMNLDLLFGQALLWLKKTHPSLKYRVVLVTGTDLYKWRVVYRKIFEKSEGAIFVRPGKNISADEKRRKYLRNEADILIGYSLVRRRKPVKKEYIDLKDLLETEKEA